MKTYNFRVDYYIRAKNLYTYKVVSVRANSEEEGATKAIKKARVKNIEDVTLVSMEE